MTPTIDPAHTALLSMDFQNAIVGRLEDADALVARQAAAIAAARAAGVTIAHVRVGFADGDALAGQMAKRVPPEMRAHFHADAPGTQIHPDLTPAPADIVVRKIRVGAFSTTDLHDQLQARGIDTLILTGISTSGVVLSTVRDAHDKDYTLIVVSDLMADPAPAVHDFLVGTLYPHQAEVIDSSQLSSLL
jgi:nicotinamidase-related amidase